MGAARTLDRKRTKERVTLPDGQVVFADRPDRQRGLPKGSPFRSVTTLTHPTAASPYEVTFHATKGARRVRVAV